MWVVEGLEHGHVALVAKVHHAAIDGASGVEVLASLVDLEPTPLPANVKDDEPWLADRVPSDVEMIGASMVSIARQPVRMARATVHLGKSLARLVTRMRNEDVRAGVPFTAPRLSWNVMITPHRQVAFTGMSLDDVKLVKDAYGATVNDVVLAVLSGAFRRYFVARAELPDRPLVAVIPTSVRSMDEKQLGNRVSAMFTQLSTDLDDPLARLGAVQDTMSGAKQVHEDIGGNTLEEWAELAAPAMLARGARLYSQLRLADRHPPIHNLVVSNVPGPQFPLYMAGARLVDMYPMGPVFDGAGLNVTAMSYRDRVDIGFMACLEAVPDLWALAAEVPESLAELVKVARDATPAG
jgi:WS/DGAT/MGAT family acyltransferase